MDVSCAHRLRSGHWAFMNKKYNGEQKSHPKDA